jgi:GntR family transcriptional repressor for pyruvate dehydrogenase complex
LPEVIFLNDPSDFIDALGEKANLSVTKASTAIYEQIKEKVRSKQILPGERLPTERDMMVMFGRSRPTVREALRLLESEGYITTVSGKKGAVVNRLTTSTIERPLANMLTLGKISNEELIDFRTVNDKNCIKWAIQRQTETDIERISSILGKELDMNYAQLGRDEFVHLMILYDIEFHNSIAKASHNSVAYTLSKVMTNIYFQRLGASVQKMSEEELILFNRDICKSHKDILEAFRKSDLEKAYLLILDNAYSYSSRINIDAELPC